MYALLFDILEFVAHLRSSFEKHMLFLPRYG